MNEGGKGFGGGEATRDPEPTEIDPNDPKGKQQAIHKAESFAEYLAKRSAGGGGARANIVMSEVARASAVARRPGDPEPTEIDPNDPKGKQQAIHKAESFAEYLAKRSAGGGARANIVMNEGGKGFGGGEATCDPEPTEIDPNDPKGKQQAIHKAESFGGVPREALGRRRRRACQHRHERGRQGLRRWRGHP